MRFISTKAHGILDYLMGIVLIAAPWLFGFAEGSYETWIPVAVGASIIVMSLLTDYELGASRKIPMKTHLWIDGIVGGFLATSPWFFGFADYVYLPHLILGLGEIGAALCTHLVADDEVVHREERANSHRESHV